MKKFIGVLLFFAWLGCHAQVSSPSIVVVPAAPSGGCSNNLPDQQTVTVGALYSCQNGTWGQISGSGSFGGKYVFLSSASDIGAQIVSAITALGGAGVIVLPNSTNIPFSTTATNIPQGISFTGYGKMGSIINCTVAGDCFQISQNPTTNGEIGGRFSHFAINGSGALNQVLIHGIGASGWTFDDMQFQPYPGTSGNAAVCLEFENNASGIFTERNTVLPSVYFERQCTPSLYLHQDSGGDSSFAYNHFDISGVAQGANYVVIVDGTSRLYGGYLRVRANYIGPGGGIVEFNNSSGSGGTTLPSEWLDISAEAQTNLTGTLLNANSTGAMNFVGTIMNGPGGASGLTTTIGGSNAANVHVTNVGGNYTIPGTMLVQGGAVFPSSGSEVSIQGNASLSGVQFDNSAFSGGKIWEMRLNNGSGNNQMYLFDRTDGDAALVLNQATNADVLSYDMYLPRVIYSAAGTALPTCATALKGQEAVVSDATSPTYLGTYTSGGAVASPVMCNGTIWVTY